MCNSLLLLTVDLPRAWTWLIASGNPAAAEGTVCVSQDVSNSVYGSFAQPTGLHCPNAGALCAVCSACTQPLYNASAVKRCQQTPLNLYILYFFVFCRTSQVHSGPTVCRGLVRTLLARGSNHRLQGCACHSNHSWPFLVPGFSIVVVSARIEISS